MLRIVLFVATNLAVLAVLGTILGLLGAVGLLPPQVLEARGGLLAFASVLGFGGALLSLLLSKRVAKWSTRARVIDPPRTPLEGWLVDTVARLARREGIGRPEVGIYESSQPNAFATGSSKHRSFVAVSTGLLRRLDRREVEAVLAHEVSHVANGDMITLALLQGVLNTFVIVLARVVGGLVDHVVFRNERGYGPGFWITTLVAEICLGVLATVLVMAFSRWRELRADDGARRQVGAAAMIDALVRLSGASDETELPESLRTFGIRGGRSFSRLFASHPSIVARIERLRAGEP